MSNFLTRHPEKAEFNQYWFSQPTIEALVQQIQELSKEDTRIACISTPSLWFSLPQNLQPRSVIFDIDPVFGQKAPFVLYDFNSPREIPVQFQNSFDLAVIDPPFITEQVWAKYAQTIKLVLKEGGKIILSSIAENENMLRSFLGVEKVQFMPSIPHLVYQYSFFTNYPPSVLSRSNPEIPE